MQNAYSLWSGVLLAGIVAFGLTGAMCQKKSGGGDGAVVGGYFAPVKAGVSALNFNVTQGESGLRMQTLTITNQGQNPLTWAVVDDAGWLFCSPAGGTIATWSSATVTVQLAPGSLTAGAHVATLTFNNTGVAGLAATKVAVQVNVAAAGAAPVVTSGPDPVNARVGQMATFAVTVSGTGPITQQWYRNGLPIPGGTGVSYTTPAVILSDDGTQYSVSVSNAGGTVFSTGARLSVTLAAGVPVVMTPPADQAAAVGDVAVFTVAVSGDSPLTYQWQKEGVDLVGATAASYTTPALAITDNNNHYRVVVGNGFGTATSGAATLVVYAALPPVIVSEPQDTVVHTGDPAVFNVAVSGSATLSFQWRKNGVAIGGATASSYTTPGTVSADSGAHFDVVITNAAGAVTSRTATLNLAADSPTIVTSPADVTAQVATTATFSVTAVGAPTLTYQWYCNGLAVAGATTGSYTTPLLMLGNDYDTYSVTVTNGSGTATSTPATLRVDPGELAPRVTQWPQNTRVWGASTVTFWVVATGAEPLTYQWQKLGVNIGGATSASYTTPTLPDGGSTGYRVIVSNPYGRVISPEVWANTYNSPGSGPSGQIVERQLVVLAGQPATFTIDEVQGSVPVTIQWRRNGTDIPGANGSTYTLTPANLADSGAQFTLHLSNATGTADSEIATLTVLPFGVAPTITNDFGGLNCGDNYLAEFIAIATGTQPLSYTWYRDGELIPGATASVYRVPVTVQDSGAEFKCRVSNAYGSTFSNPMNLTVNPGQIRPIITLEPQPQAVAAGATASFTVRAYASPPVSYQWRKNGTNIGGASSQTYTTPATVLGDNGATFSVIVTDVKGSTTSADAVLAVSAAATAPTVTTAPANQTVNHGARPIFTVTAAGSPPLAYQWQRNGLDIPGATDRLYAGPPATTSDSGAAFACVVSNGSGSATSSAATLTVASAGAAPSVTTNPVNTTVNEGADATFTAAGSASGTVVVQWYRDGTVIPGATADSYTLSNSMLTDSGASFTAVYANAYGATSSAAGTLTVNPNPVPPTIDTDPGDVTVTAPATATFTVAAHGPGTLSYQWRKNGSDILGATATSYTTPATTLADNLTSFSVAVTNGYGTTVSSAAVLKVN